MSTPASNRPYQAPPLRPAAVIAVKGDALRPAQDFALALKARGFRVGGLYQETTRQGGRKTGMSLVGIATGRRVSIHQNLGQAASCTVDTRGMAEAAEILIADRAARPDLVFVNKFSQLEREGGGLRAEMLALVAEGIPLLTTVAPEHLDAWIAATGGQSELVPSEPEALWRWWGPARLYPDLVLAVGPGKARRAVVGLNWTMVEGPDGVGLARTPLRGGEGCRAVPEAGAFAGLELARMAQWVDEADPFRAALGVAAINAALNRTDLAGDSENGLDAYAGLAGPVAVIGRFPGLTDRLKDVRLVEMAPAPGEYPAQAAPWLLPNVEAAVITAATLANHTLPGLLAAARGRRVALVGPGTPLSPRLFEYGIEILSGLVIEDAEGLARTVAEGGAAKALKRHGRLVTLRRP
ncbi:MAG: DUF2478 domain-containing protein [Rhodospirillales bacterium]|nr:DUF2478 domain-containing protein [Rhodospirillales bacterium]